MGKIKINDVHEALGVKNTQDVLNQVLSATRTLDYVPQATPLNIGEVGQGILETQQSRNDFVTTLVDRIGLVVIVKKHLNNPLKKFKKGKLPFGKTIEEVFTDIIQESPYDPDKASNEVFKRVKPTTLTNFHQINREGMFKQTIQEITLQKAFTSWNSMDDFITSIFTALYNSAEVHEYMYMKKLLDEYIGKGLMNTVTITDPFTDADATKDLVKKIRATTGYMTMEQGSRNYNNMGVHTTSDRQSLHLFITPDLESEIDVEVLAAAFNLSKAEVSNNITLVEGFADPTVKAVLVDDAFFVVYDRLYKMTNIYNSEGLYWNHTLHIHQLLSASRFANAVAFTIDDTPASNVLSLNINANNLKLNPGDTLLLETHFITENNEVPIIDTPLTWGVRQISGDVPTTLPTPVYGTLNKTVSLTIPTDFPNSVWEINTLADIEDNELPGTYVESEPIIIEITDNPTV